MEKPFTKNKVLLKVALSPHESGAPLEGIKQQLNKMLLKFSDELKGVPITYSDIHFPVGKEFGRILDEQPWIHADVRTTMIVFQPCVGLSVRGRINKVSASYVSLLIYGMFNASISDTQLHSKSYSYREETQQWINESTGSEYGEGDHVECIIDSFQHANGVISLVCTLTG